MAAPREREKIEYDAPVEKESGFNLSDFFAGYMQSIESSKASAASQINSAYDKAVENANAQKVQIGNQADQAFRDI